jgi:hypothetical protein
MPQFLDHLTQDVVPRVIEKFPPYLLQTAQISVKNLLTGRGRLPDRSNCKGPLRATVCKKSQDASPKAVLLWEGTENCLVFRSDSYGQIIASQRMLGRYWFVRETSTNESLCKNIGV